MGGRPLRSSARRSLEAGAGAAAGAAAGAGAEAGAAAAASAQAAARRAAAARRQLEVEDSPRVLRDKCRRLARALRNAKHLVVYTGAGISTAADIPDYRGPHGVWTRLQRGETVGRVEVSSARPTFTHMALRALWSRGALKFVVSQNCDGLHLRSGLPRRALAELHGDMFCEWCPRCPRAPRAPPPVYLRAFDTTQRTARHRHGTARLCHGCGHELRDSIVHFGERGRARWPLNWAGALRHARRADVVLCLGSSLKVLRRYPRLWRMQRARSERPRLYIVNLQWTPKDAAAELKINARCDAVMRQVARRLRLRVPRYSPRRDPLLAHAEPLLPPEAHTTRRPHLAPPSSPSPPSSPASPPASPSPSASDSDEEVPLRRLADQLRTPHSLRAFRVTLHSGEATILLRAEHAPSAHAPPPPPPPSATAALRRFRIVRPPRPAPPSPHAPHAPNGALLAHANGRPPLPEPEGLAPASPVHVKVEHSQPLVCAKKEDTSELDELMIPINRTAVLTCKKEEDSDHRDKPKRMNGTAFVVSKYGRSPEVESALADKEEKAFKVEPECKLVGEQLSPSPATVSASASASGALAAAFFARAVLLCRASLYSGLHTIIAPPAAAPPPPPPAPPPPPPQPPPAPQAAQRAEEAECSWCLRRLSALRCQWYGPPRRTAAEARCWRPEAGKRFLCACCGPDDDCQGGADNEGDGDGEGGWYGKGYRKGRRRRR